MSKGKFTIKYPAGVKSAARTMELRRKIFPSRPAGSADSARGRPPAPPPFRETRGQWSAVNRYSSLVWKFFWVFPSSSARSDRRIDENGAQLRMALAQPGGVKSAHGAPHNQPDVALFNQFVHLFGGFSGTMVQGGDGARNPPRRAVLGGLGRLAGKRRAVEAVQVKYHSAGNFTPPPPSQANSPE